jgi:hypothetical protein
MNPPTTPSPTDPPTGTPPPSAPPPSTLPPSSQPPASLPPPLEPGLPDKLDLKSLFEALLRRPYSLIPSLAKPEVARMFAGIAVVSFLLFGVVLGCFAKHEQLWAAPLKLTGGILFAAVICFPSLYIFATLAGARVTLPQLASALAGALALAGLLLLGFAPAVWIFAESTDAFGFMGFLAIGAWLIALFFGLRFLKSVLFLSDGTQQGPMIVWSIVFLLVTLQLTTSLRPILGRTPNFLPQEKKFFLQHWGDTMGNSLNGPPQAEATDDARDDGNRRDGTEPAPAPPASSDTQRNPYNK